MMLLKRLLSACLMMPPVHGFAICSKAASTRTRLFVVETDSSFNDKTSKSLSYSKILSTEASELDRRRRETLAGSAALLPVPLLMEFLPAELKKNMQLGAAANSMTPLAEDVLRGDSIVRSLWLGRLTYPVLVVSLEMGLFEALKHGPLTKEELAHRLNPPISSNGRVMEAMTAVLSSLGLLHVNDSGSTVSLAEPARHVLLEDSPFFWGPQLLAADGVTSTLRRAVHRDGKATKDYAGYSNAVIDSFIDSMQAHGSVTAKATAQALDPILGHSSPTPAAHILDMAGGSGCFSQELCCCGMRVTLADLPPVVASFRHRRRHHHSPASNIDAVPVDLFHAETWPIGPDCHLMANVIHDWGEPQVQDILQTSCTTLRKSKTGGGRLVLIEQLLADDKTGPLPAALASVSMLLGDWRSGKQYSFAELQELCKAAGFCRVERGPQCGEFHTAVIAYTD